MKREKYRYDQWPAGGVAGVSADHALELAATGRLHAYAYVDGLSLPVRRIHREKIPRLEEPVGMVGNVIVLLFPSTVFEIEHTGTSEIVNFQCFRWQSEEGEDKVSNWFYSILWKETSWPLPVVEKDALIFYTADIEVYAAAHGGVEVPSAAPAELSDNSVLEYLVKTKDRDIRSQTALDNARKCKMLFDQARTGGNLNKSEAYKEVREKLAQECGLNEKPPSENTIEKCIRSLVKAEQAIKSAQ